MTIHFNLADRARTVSIIRLIIHHKGKVYRTTTGISCKCSDWSQKKERTGNVRKDEELKNIRIRLLSRLDDFSTDRDIKRAISYAIDGKEETAEPRTPTFMEYFRQWGDVQIASIRQRRLAYNNTLALMGDGHDWDDITEAFMFRLLRGMQDNRWGVNYQGRMVKCIKAVMNEGYRLGYHRNMAYRDFKAPSAPVENIYLNDEEMDRIWNYKSRLSMEMKVAHLAMLGYLTCARFSDYSRLSEANIGDDGMLRFSQQKTGRTVVIPCSPKIRKILELNGGKAPKISQQNFNTTIKDICRKLGIDDKVEITSMEGRDRVRRVYEKWELVSSHTFRRSAATNLYLAGVPLRSIMQLTGHSTIAMLERYLKVTGEENAIKLADNPFFK